MILLIGQLIDGQKLLVCVEAEMLVVIVGEIVSAGSVADDEQLHEAQQGVGIAIAALIFIVHHLLHGLAGIDLQRFQLNLYHW